MDKRIVGALSLILIAVSVWFRIWHLGNIPGLNGDEAEYGSDSINLLHGHSIDMYTQSGHIKNVLYYIPVLFLHAVFPPSVVLLRATAVFCGIAAIVVNYVLCRRVFGQTCAVLTSLLIAVLPENIAQSRLGWDPCESVLIDLLVVYGSLEVVQRGTNPIRAVVGAILACIAAYVVHPSNLFADLFLPIAIVIRWAPEIRTYFATGNRVLRCMLAAGLVILVIAGGTIGLRDQLAAARKIGQISERNFVLNYAALFSGRTIYKYIADYPRPVGNMDAIDQLSVLPWIFCVGYCLKLFAERQSVGNVDRLIAAGWLIELAAYAGVAGAGNLEPGNERYSLCLIGPGILLLVRALQCSISNRPRLAWGASSSAIFLSTVFLLTFYTCYFRYIMATGGPSWETFATASKEPKVAAVDYVVSQCPAGTQCYIVCHSWYTYQAARYFAMGHANVHVPLIPRASREEIASVFRAMYSGNLWTIDFISAREQEQKEFAIPGIDLAFIEVLTYAGRPIVLIGHPVRSQVK